MYHTSHIHGPLRRVKSHYNLSANDFTVTGMAALAVSVNRGIDISHISISINKVAWDQLVTKYPLLKSQVVRNSLRKQKYIRLFDNVFAECENIPDKDSIWVSGYKFVKQKVVRAELKSLRAEAVREKDKELYDKWLEYSK